MMGAGVWVGLDVLLGVQRDEVGGLDEGEEVEELGRVLLQKSSQDGEHPGVAHDGRLLAAEQTEDPSAVWSVCDLKLAPS